MPLAPYVVVPDVITAVAPERSADSISEQIDGIIRGLTNPAQEINKEDEGDAENRVPGHDQEYSGTGIDAYLDFNSDYLNQISPIP